jgi:hypothetical protein
MSRIVSTSLLLLVPLLAGSPAWASELYFTQRQGGSDAGIHRVDLNTMEVESLIPSGITSPYRIAVDALGERMYWTADLEVYRARLDGSNVEVIFTSEGG